MEFSDSQAEKLLELLALYVDEFDCVGMSVSDIAEDLARSMTFATNSADRNKVTICASV